MKILFVATYYTSNTYLNEIVDNLKEHCEIVCSAESFWSSNLHFDIIHFQWPEAVFFTLPNPFKTNFIERVQQRMDYWKNKGAKLVSTRHNEVSHYDIDEAEDLYNIIYKQSHAVVHLGKYSLENLAYNNLNVIIPHPNYNNTIKLEITKSKARQYLNIPKDAKVFLSFGKIRKNEEESNLIEAFLKLDSQNKLLIICNSIFNRKFFPFRISPVARIKHLFQKRIYKRKKIWFGQQNISDDLLTQYIIASDVIISPRIDTLNSGVIFMAYSFGKAVVGPSVGNMKDILEETENPTFLPYNCKSYTNALQKAYENAAKLEMNNKKFSDLNFESKKIAEMHFNLYKTLLNKG